MDSIQQRVRRGAKALDNAVPKWYEKIDFVDFDIRNTSLCAAGQIAASSGKGYDVFLGGLLGTTWRDVQKDYGFAPYRPDEWGASSTTFKDAWYHEVNQRMAAAGSFSYSESKSLLTDAEKHVLTVLIAEQREKLQQLFARGEGVGQLLEQIFKEQSLALEQIELKLELAND